MVEPVLEQLVARFSADPMTVGLVLMGSQGAGTADAGSDIDVMVVLSEDALERRRIAGESLHWREGALDLFLESVEALTRLAEAPDWRTPGFLEARVLLDRTGELEPLVQSIPRLKARKAQADTAGWLDAYLNAFYRSIKALSRGNRMGGHLEAAESMMHLVRTLFSLHGLCTPYWDRLDRWWDRLERGPWRGRELPDRLEEILQSASPSAQQRLEAEVEDLLRREGYGHVFDAWGEELPRVKSLRLP